MLHLYRSPLRHESRIERACATAREVLPSLRIVVAGIQPGNLLETEITASGAELRRFPMPVRTWCCRGPLRTRVWDATVEAHFASCSLRAVSAHSFVVLPLAVRLSRRKQAALIYEPHELESHRAHAPGWLRWWARWTERRLLPSCRAVVVVSDSIADWYARMYRMPRPVVVRNMPELKQGRPEVNPRLWRERFGIPDDHLVFIYQGGLFRGRRIEQLVRVFAQAKADRHVVFMGYGELENVVRDAAGRLPNIHFAPAVPPADVLRHTAAADIGLVGVENICLSYYFSLPNKLFEYFAADIPALMPAFPEMLRVVTATGCGWTVHESDAEWLTIIDSLDRETICAAKVRTRNAEAHFSWVSERQKLDAIYRPLLKT